MSKFNLLLLDLARYLAHNLVTGNAEEVEPFIFGHSFIVSVSGSLMIVVAAMVHDVWGG